MGLRWHNTGLSARQRLGDVARAQGPAIIMVHGYKYDPVQANHCPHAKLFSKKPGRWPDALGYGHGDPQEGIGIALGWDARGPLWKVHQRAAKLGESLAVLISLLHLQNPHRPVHVISHSLGCETALSSLSHLPANSVDRMVLLTGASYASQAVRMLDTPAGRSTQVFNITSRENDLFDYAFEQLVPAPQKGDVAIGQGIASPNAVTMQLDCPKTLGTLGTLGFAVAPSQRRICHWSAYKRPGVMAFYKSLLRDDHSPSIAALGQLLPAFPAPRWSRMIRPKNPRVLPKPVTLPMPPLALRLKNRFIAGSSTRGKNNEHAY